MTADPNALEALLQKVQRNREKLHPSGAPAASSAFNSPGASVEPARPDATQAYETRRSSTADDLEADPFAASFPPDAPASMPPAASTGYAMQTPEAEAPFGGRHSQPAPHPATDRPKPIITFPPTMPPSGEMGRSVRPSAAPVEAEGSILSAPPAPHSTRPIAQVVSRHPAADNATFGQLLTRSLSLRPR